MSLQTLRKDLNKCEDKREEIKKKIKDILHLEELSSLYEDLLLSFDVDNITVNLDDKTTLNIKYPCFDTKVSIIRESNSFFGEKEMSTIIFKEVQSKYSRVPEINALNFSELSEFYHKLEPYKEVLEDKIEEGIRKNIEFDKLIKKEV